MDPPRVLRTTASTMEKKRPRLDWASLQRRTFEEDTCAKEIEATAVKIVSKVPRSA